MTVCFKAMFAYKIQRIFRLYAEIEKVTIH